MEPGARTIPQGSSHIMRVHDPSFPLWNERVLGRTNAQPYLHVYDVQRSATFAQAGRLMTRADELLLAVICNVQNY